MIMNGLSQGGGSYNRVPIIYNTSYVGTGTYGVNNPTTLTFDFVPEIVIISGDWRYKSGSYEVSDDLSVLIFTPYTTSSTICYRTWEGGKIYFGIMRFSISKNKKIFNFYVDNSAYYIYIGSNIQGSQTSLGSQGQYNRSGITYHVLAIGYKEEA